MQIQNSSFLHNPIIHVLTGAFMISFSGVWVTMAEVPAITSAFYRMFFGLLFLAMGALIKKEFRIPAPGLIVPIMLCGLFFAFDLYFWHTSIQYVGPGLATILGNFQVFLLAAWGSVFLLEKLRLRFLLSLPLAVVGLLLVIGFNWTHMSGDYRLGIFFGLMTAICYTAFLLILRKIQSSGDPSSFFSTLIAVSLITALLIGIEMVIAGETFTIPTSKSLFSLICLGLFSQAIGWLLIANAMPKIQASFTGLILLLQPSCAFIWDVLFFDRQTDLTSWVGVCITLSAIYMGLTGSERKS